MRTILRTTLFLVVAAAIVLYAAGFFGSDPIAPEDATEVPGLATPDATAAARRAEVDLVEPAVGTVASRMRVGVAAQVTGRVLRVTARAGETVAAGTVLVELDSRELTARQAQAREGLEAAQANRERQIQAKRRAEALLKQAEARHRRIVKLIDKGAATPEQMESTEAGLMQAHAGVDDALAAIAAAEAKIEQSKEVVAEAGIALGHSRIVAPIDGVVAERLVEPGDLAWSGRNLLVVLDPKALRLEAQVREGLIGRVGRGAKLRVELPAAGRTVEGTVREVIPWADPASRTFRVRVDFEFLEGVYPGMFGRLRVPVGKREVVVVAATAIERVGQLETVVVKSGERWTRRLVTTGARLDDKDVEVLSGLRAGETVGTKS
ncbi:MAG: efflux RND transporter periplasmic adaptor subunit [Planctomycetota bacterium]|jgi:RND family efflux transporter MFP subunit